MSTLCGLKRCNSGLVMKYYFINEGTGKTLLLETPTPPTDKRLYRGSGKGGAAGKRRGRKRLIDNS